MRFTCTYGTKTSNSKHVPQLCVLFFSHFSVCLVLFCCRRRSRCFHMRAFVLFLSFETHIHTHIHTTFSCSRTWLSALRVVCKCEPPRERILSLLFFHLLLRLSCCCCCYCVSRQQAIGRWFIFYQISKEFNAVANARFIRLDRVVSSRQVCVCVLCFSRIQRKN